MDPQGGHTTHCLHDDRMRIMRNLMMMMMMMMMMVVMMIIMTMVRKEDTLPTVYMTITKLSGDN